MDIDMNQAKSSTDLLTGKPSLWGTVSMFTGAMSTAAMLIALSMFSHPLQAAVKIPSCFKTLGLQTPASKVDTLYIFIDQTTYLTKAMKTNIIDLVSDWGRHGDRVKILRFSANIKGQFTELMFNETIEAIPSEEYLFHLRTKDKKNLLACLDKNRDDFSASFTKSLSASLKLTKHTLPKTDLFYNLQQITAKTMNHDDEKQQTVLIITDGLENSDYLRFHGKGAIKRIHAKSSIKRLKKRKLIAKWRQADIYMYGLGHISNKDHYARPKLIERLKDFWSRYFREGKGKLKQLGTPEILLSSIR